MATRQEHGSRKPAAKKAAASSSRDTARGSSRESSPRPRSGASTLRNVVTTAAATETLIDLVDRLGLVDVVLGRVKSRIQETDIDEIMEDATDYLRRNPEVLVVSLGAVTVATGLLVWLNNRREWDGNERRGTGKRTPARATRKREVEEEEEEVEEY